MPGILLESYDSSELQNKKFELLKVKKKFTFEAWFSIDLLICKINCISIRVQAYPSTHQPPDAVRYEYLY